MQLKLPTCGFVSLPMSSPKFERAEPIWNTSINKTILKKPWVLDDGKPVLAEIKILRIFERDGWSGRWASTFGGLHFYSDVPQNFTKHCASNTPKDIKDIVSKVQKRSGRKGCLDVVAWKPGNLVFAEAKHYQKDSLTTPQKLFIDASLQSGFTEDQFLIVEWRIEQNHV